MGSGSARRRHMVGWCIGIGYSNLEVSSGEESVRSKGSRTDRWSGIDRSGLWKSGELRAPQMSTGTTKSIFCH